MRLIGVIILFIVFSCSNKEYSCYECIQLKTTTFQRSYTCGKIDTISYIDTLYNSTRCDTKEYIEAFEHNATNYCVGTKMICKLKLIE